MKKTKRRLTPSEIVGNLSKLGAKYPSPEKTAAKKLAKIAAIFEQVTPAKIAPGITLKGATTSTHAALNLYGAIIDIERNRGRCDAVCMQTLKRVAKQLAQIGKVLDERG